jgi:hypothetical protein
MEGRVNFPTTIIDQEPWGQQQQQQLEWNGMYSLEQRPNQRTTNQSFILLGENLKRTCGSKSSFIGGEFCPQTIYKNCEKKI